MSTETQSVSAETTVESSQQTQDTAPATPARPPELVAAMEAHKASLDARLGKGARASEHESTEPAGASSAAPAAQTTQDEVKGKEGAPEVQPEASGEQASSTPDKAAQRTEDTPADVIGKYLRQTRLAEEARKQAAAEASAAKAAAEEAKRAHEAAEAAKREAAQERAKAAELRELAKTKPDEAIRRLVGDTALRDSTVIIDLVEKLGKGEAIEAEGTQGLTQEQIIERVVAAVKAQQEADRKAEAEKQEAEAAKTAQEKAKEIEANRAAYFTGLNGEFEAKRHLYPFMASKRGGVSREAIDQWLQSRYAQTHALPSPDQIFEHFNEECRQEALAYSKSLGIPTQTSGQPKPPTLSPSAAIKTGVDSRGKPPVPTTPLSLKDERELIVRRLEQTSAK